MNGIKDSVAIHGIGWAEWPIHDMLGNVGILRTQAYYVPEASIRLCSTQSYFQENLSGNLYQDHEKIVLTLASGQEMTFPHDRIGNLPLMLLDPDIPHAGMTGQHSLNLSTSPLVEETMTMIDRNHNLPKRCKELLLIHCRLWSCRIS